MKKIYWYEVFEDRGEYEGTQTLQEFNTLKEARKYKRKLVKSRMYIPKLLHIDKWQVINHFPEPIADIE